MSRITVVSFAARAGRSAVLAAVLAFGLLTGCSGDGTDVDCNLNACTVTMDRGVDAQAKVLGVDIKLVGVAGDQVTLDVEGSRVSIPAGGNGSTQVAGLTVTVQEVTGDKVVLKVTQG